MGTFLTMLTWLACNESGINALSDDAANGGDLPAAVPHLTLTPPAVDFGAVPSGTSPQATLIVGNDGQARLDVSDLFVNGGAPVRLAHVGNLSLDPGSELIVDLTWSATWGVPLDAELVVVSNDPDVPRAKAQLTGTVLGPDVSLTPATWDFGVQPRGVSADQSFTLSNLGDAPLTVDRVAYGASSPELALVDDAGLTAGGLIEPGGSRTFVVRYTPTDGDADEGVLQVFSDDADTPEIDASQFGSGEPSVDHDVEVLLTADDAWEGWIDGVKITSAPNAALWSTSDRIKATLASGDHVIAVHAYDLARSISGINGVIQVDGATLSTTGDGGQRVVSSAPGAGWTDLGYDDTAWTVAPTCASTSPWGASPADIVGLGGRWVWWTSRCESLGETWMRWTITLP
jgi:hypothetical protein